MTWKNSILSLFSAVVLCAGVWLYVSRVLIPHRHAYAAERAEPLAVFSDFFPPWWGARELLLHHRDPYSPEVKREIQIQLFGRPLDPARKGDPKDQQAFAYPVHLVFLLAPTVNLSFNSLRRPITIVWICLLAGTVICWWRILRWNGSKTLPMVLLLAMFASYPVVQTLCAQQLSAMIAAMLALGAALIAGGQLGAAGIVFAFATVKPHLTLPLVGWLLVWSLARWQERWAFLVGFATTLAALLAAANLLLPGWMGEFYESALAYVQYTGAGTGLLELLLTSVVGQILTVLIILGTVYFGFSVRAEAVESPIFWPTFVFILAVTVLIVPMIMPYNQLLLLPGIFLLFRDWKRYWPRTLTMKLGLVLVAGLLSWQVVAASILAVGSFLLPASMVQKAWAIPLYTNPLLPMAVVAALAFYLRTAFSLQSSKLNLSFASQDLQGG